MPPARQQARRRAATAATINANDAQGAVAQQIVQTGFVIPVGGGSSFTTAPLLEQDLKVSLPTTSKVAKVLAEYSDGIDGERTIFDHSLLASFVLRTTPVDEECHSTPIFGAVLSVKGVAAAIEAIEELQWDEYIDSATSAIRSLAEKGKPPHTLKRSDFIEVEPLPGNAAPLTIRRWKQTSSLLIGDLIGGDGPIWAQNSLLATLVAGVGAYGRASDREDGGRALAFLNEVLREVSSVVKQNLSSLKREIISRLALCGKVPSAIAIFPCSLAEAVDEISFGALMSAGSPNAVLARLPSALAALPLLSDVCAQASDVAGAVIRLAKAFNHPDSIVFNTLESIDGQLEDHRDIIKGESQGAVAGSRTASIIDLIETRIRAARNYDRANAASGLADPNAAKLEITSNAAVLQSPSFKALDSIISDTKLGSERKLQLIMQSREMVCLKAFYEHRTSFPLSQPCRTCAEAHHYGGPYLQWICTHDEDGITLPRCEGHLFQLSAADVRGLLHGDFKSVNWAAIGAAYCKLTVPGGDIYAFPATIGEMPNVVDLYFPLFKRIFIGLGFAPIVFNEFEAKIVEVAQHTLPGNWLTGLINESFKCFLEAKTNELTAFLGTALSFAVFPGAPDESSKSAQVIASALAMGDELLRSQHRHTTSLAAAAPLRSLQTPHPTAPGILTSPSASHTAAASLNALAASGSASGNGQSKQKRKIIDKSSAAVPVATTVATHTGNSMPHQPGHTPKPGKPGKCVHLVQANAAGTLLKIGRVDVFDAEQLVADVRARAPGFDIDLKRDILLLAAWLAEGSEDQRARFVPAGCDQRFLTYPFSPFDKLAYKTSKNF